MGLLDWFRRRKNRLEAKMLEEEEAAPVDEEKEALERTRKLQTEIEEHMKEEQNNACQHEEVT